MFCAYILRLPDGTPFYVGSGTMKRARDLPHNNSEAIGIIMELRSRGESYLREREFFETRNEAVKRELELINKYGRRIDGGKLCNLRIGDRGGVQGRKWSAEQTEKVRKRMMGNTYRRDSLQRAQ